MEQKMKKGLISIIIPVYNCSDYIKEAIESCLAQTYSKIEIIAVNDGSTDNSLEILEKYSSIDSRIKIISKENGGVSSARNTGIDHSSGEYLLMLDGDDWLESNCCEMMINKAKECNTDIVIGDIYKSNEGNRCVWQDSAMDDNELLDGKEFMINYYFLGSATNSLCNKLIKKSLFEENEIRYPIDIYLGEDGETLLKLYLCADKVCKINVPVYNYRMNLNSATRNNNKKVMQYKTAFSRVKEYFISNNGKEIIESYEMSLKYKLYYSNVLEMPCIVSYMNKYSGYIQGWEDLKKEIKQLVKNEKIKCIVSKKMYLRLRVYSINVFLADIITILGKVLINR